MIASLKQNAAARKTPLAVLLPTRLDEIAAELKDFAAGEELNGFQQWIVAHKYHLTLPAELPFTPRSLILQAVAHPFYAFVEVTHAGRTQRLRCLVKADFAAAENALQADFAADGFQLAPAPDLPFKRLGAHSLAAYGRNNITYVQDLGSSFSYAGYFSDLPSPDSDDWHEALTLAEPCRNCQSCLNHCPTGAIRKERFLIDNERCLSYFNEVPDPFPAWIQPEWHNCLYDCLLCQENCPMNRHPLEVLPETIRFSADETEQILAGAPLTDFSPEFQATARHLGLDDWWGTIPRNIRGIVKEIS